MKKSLKFAEIRCIFARDLPHIWRGGSKTQLIVPAWKLRCAEGQKMVKRQDFHVAKLAAWGETFVTSRGKEPQVP